MTYSSAPRHNAPQPQPANGSTSFRQPPKAVRNPAIRLRGVRVGAEPVRHVLPECFDERPDLVVWEVAGERERHTCEHIGEAQPWFWCVRVVVSQLADERGDEVDERGALPR